MPFICTHFYTAARIALSFVGDQELEGKLSNKNFLLVRDIGNGMLAWLAANRTFREGANAAIAAKDGDLMQKVMDQYRNTIYKTETIAIFSAFATGSQGPDLWTCPRWDELEIIPHQLVYGDYYFDMGHYNRTHTYPLYALKDLQENGDSLDLRQYKYRAAYILGYLTHIALDIHSHLKVNVFAGAYFQLKKVWETEQTSGPFTGILEGFKEPFNNHNKIEQYFDAFVRFLCFEGYYPEMEPYNHLRTDILQQPAAWDFPNYDNYWSKYLSFGFLGLGNGINNADEAFLNISTSLAGPFAYHYRDESDFPVQPFITSDMQMAFLTALDSYIVNSKRGFKKIKDEKERLQFFAMDSTGTGMSHYYNMRTASPNLDKVVKYTDKFYNVAAFCEFLRGSITLGRTFVGTALEFLEDGNADHLHHLKNWNLDTGIAIRIRKPKEPGVPGSPVRIDLINSLEYPDLTGWMHTTLQHNWPQQNATNPWPVPTPEKPADQPEVKLELGCSSKYKIKPQPQMALRIKLTHNRHYSEAETDEIGAFLFADAEKHSEPWVKQEPSSISEPDGACGYHLKTCIEDFSDKTGFAQTEERKNGASRLKDYITMFYGFNKAVEAAQPQPQAGADAGKDRIYPLFRQLPRHVRFAFCRKWIMQEHDGTWLWPPWNVASHGNFTPDKQRIHQTVSPSEELVMSIFAVYAKDGTYYDLFYEDTFTQDQIDSLKMVKVIGINTILLIFLAEEQGLLTLDEAYIDGELQDLTKDEEHDYPPNVSPIPDVPDIPVPDDDNCYCLRLEDVLFRTNSAVFLPAGYSDRTSFDLSQDQADGFQAIAALYKHAAMFPRQKLIITAHTDTVASAQFNCALSNDRGASVLAILEGDRNAWAGLAMQRNHAEDIQTICKWFNDKYAWNCDPGKIDGIHGPNTQTAIKNLKAQYNKQSEFGHIVKENGTLDKETWAMIFDLYQREIALLINTTYGDMPAKYASWQDRWVDSGRKATGCSEAFPKEQPDRNDYECAVNRRVEVFFFGNKLLENKGTLCEASRSAATQSQAQTRLTQCRQGCKVFKDMPEPQYIKV